MTPPAVPDHAASNATETTAQGPSAALPEQAAAFVGDVHAAIADGLAAAEQTVGEAVTQVLPIVGEAVAHLPAALVG